MKSGTCSTTFTVLLSFLISVSVTAGTNTDIVDVDNDFAYPPDTDDFDDTELQKRRLNNFVRIGRGLSSFIRIGKSGLYVPYDELEDEDDGFDDTDTNSAFAKGHPDKRLSSFVRIGRGIAGPENYEKRAGAFIRVGKFPSSGYFRYSENISPYYRRTGRIGHSSFIRIGKRDTSNTLNDQKTREDLYNKYLELENKLGDENSDLKTEDKKLSSFVRIGRLSKFVRIGRPSSFVRIGRPSSFVRIGRPSFADEVDINDTDEYNDGNDKENEKRLSKFVRIGKNKELLNDDIFKRRLNKFMRIGRQPGLNDVDSFGDNEAFEADAKRRISSFVRIGKSGNAAQESKLETDEKA